MTETRLRTYTHLCAYAITAAVLMVLALQNLRYGFYPLFYLAALLSLIVACGAAYTVYARRQQLLAKGHLPILLVFNLALLGAMVMLDASDTRYWLLPAIVLNLLILPLRQGVVLSLGMILVTALYLGLRLPAPDALMTTMAAITLLAATGLCISHYDHMAQSAEDLAITDPVTGAHNARFLDETLQKEISRSMVTGHSLSALELSVDYLEEARDLYGETGLQPLYRELTQHLFGAIRAGDTIYSLGHGHFFLILPDTPEEGLRVIAERLRRSLSEQQWLTVGRLTISLGCTTRQPADTRGSVLRQRVERALSEARLRGHDRAWFIAEDRPDRP